MSIGSNEINTFINRNLSVIIIIFYIYIQLAYSAITFDDWQLGSPILPSANLNRGATAFNSEENVIHLVGGVQEDQILITFYIDFNAFTVSSTNFFNAFPDGIFSQGQNFVQIANVLYMTQHDDDSGTGQQIHSWDISNNETKVDAIPSVLPDVSDFSCMALYQEYMIIIEGSSNKVQILNLKTNEWLTNVPQLIESNRKYLSCGVANNELYAIAGGDVPESIEYLDLSDITDIKNYKWIQFPHIVPNPDGSLGYTEHRTVVHCDKIVIIGGITEYAGWNFVFHTDIFLLDPMSKTIMNVGHMNYGRAAPYVAITESTLYVFGGRPTSNLQNPQNTWEYHSLPACPTAMPTTMPTKTPTAATENPTETPTKAPTKAPTKTPTKAPTKTPTKTPTSATENPTKSPTDSSDDSSISSISSIDDSEENLNAISSRNEQMDSLNKKEQNNDGMNDKHRNIELSITVDDIWMSVYLLFGVMIIVYVVVICRMYMSY